MRSVIGFTAKAIESSLLSYFTISSLPAEMSYILKTQSYPMDTIFLMRE